jgi:hypothetical protein
MARTVSSVQEIEQKSGCRPPSQYKYFKMRIARLFVDFFSGARKLTYSKKQYHLGFEVYLLKGHCKKI